MVTYVRTHNLKEIKMNIKEIQDQINKLQESLDTFKGQLSFDWDNAPTIAEINGSRWILGPEAPEELNWNDAVAWCKAVGGELPTRDILLYCYMDEEIRDLFTATYYWSSTEFTATFAWLQSFSSGLQSSTNKTATNYVRAVRRLDI